MCIRDSFYSVDFNAVTESLSTTVFDSDVHNYYDLLRQLAAQIKKHTYIKLGLQQETNTESKYSSHTHAITQNYKQSAKLLHTADLM